APGPHGRRGAIHGLHDFSFFRCLIGETRKRAALLATSLWRAASRWRWTQNIVIRGRREAANPEPMHTGLWNTGSGLAAFRRRPGMTSSWPRRSPSGPSNPRPQFPGQEAQPRVETEARAPAGGSEKTAAV